MSRKSNYRVEVISVFRQTLSTYVTLCLPSSVFPAPRMATGESFFGTSVGEKRGIPPLRLQPSQPARPRRPVDAGSSCRTRLPSALPKPSAASQVTSLAPTLDLSGTVMEELEVMEDRQRPTRGTHTGSSETVYHARSSTSSSFHASDASRTATTSSQEKRQTHLLPIAHPSDQEVSLKRPKSSVVKSVKQKKPKVGKTRSVRETMMIPEEEDLEFPPLLLDSFKTKAVLAKVFLGFLYHYYRMCVCVYVFAIFFFLFYLSLKQMRCLH